MTVHGKMNRKHTIMRRKGKENRSPIWIHSKDNKFWFHENSLVLGVNRWNKEEKQKLVSIWCKIIILFTQLRVLCWVILMCLFLRNHEYYFLWHSILFNRDGFPFRNFPKYVSGLKHTFFTIRFWKEMTRFKWFILTGVYESYGLMRARCLFFGYQLVWKVYCNILHLLGSGTVKRLQLKVSWAKKTIPRGFRKECIPFWN